MNLEQLEPFLINLTFICALLATFGYLISLIKKNNEFFKNIAYLLMIVGFISITFVLVFRTILAGHAPLTNFFESMIFMIAGSFFIFLIIIYKYKSILIGITIAPFICVMMAIASILPADWKAVKPLMPALQSYWLKIHVSTVMLSYSAFILSVITAIVYLILLKRQNAPISSLDKGGVKGVEKTLLMFDELTYRLILFAFPLLAFGIISGAIWANHAWGSYWSWDPKEVAALMTWLVYAGYLHVRRTNLWGRKGSAIIAIIGFVAVIFTYYGVNYLPGLHSYGF